MEKLSLQIIIDQFVLQSGLSRRVAEQIARQFFDTIVEGLKTDGSVKINGLGTFKIVEVADRESVNVSNGERFVIPGYKKVGFTAESSFFSNKEVVRDVTSEPEVALEETPQAESSEESVLDSESYDGLVQLSCNQSEQLELNTEEPEPVGIVLSTPVIERVEVPSNELSNIDMLISTPESLAEVRLNYENACKRAEETLKIAEEANTEMVRLKRLLHNLEANLEPEVVGEGVGTQMVADNNVTVGKDAAKDETSSFDGTETSNSTDNQTEKSDVVNNTGSKDEAMLRYLNDDKSHIDDEEESSDAGGSKSRLLFWITVPLFGVILGLCAIFAYRAWRDYSQERRLSATPVNSASVVDNGKSDAKPAKAKGKATVATANAKQEHKEPVTSKDAAEPVKVAAEVKPVVTEAKPQTEAKPKAEVSKVEAVTKSEHKAKDAQTEAKSEKPKSYVMKPGDTLTKLSQRFYGSKSFVSKIIKANNFPNPDNVPIGAEVILP